MSRTIWKFPLSAQTTRVTVSRSARPLCVQMQRGTPCLWIETSPEGEQVERDYHIVGTGWDMPRGATTYVDTVQDGSFVWHIYEDAS